MKLANKVVAITGAFGNLGAAVAEAAAKEGAKLALIDHAAPAESKTQRDALLISGINLSVQEEAQSAIARTVDHFGRLDALINIAGTFRWETLENGALDTWNLLYGVNLKTAVAASKAALPHLLQSRGRIVNIGAGAAVTRAAAGMGAYAASKAGVVKLTEALSEEVKDRGMTVNAILPGTMDTPQNRASMPTADFNLWVAPQAIADVIVFLLSDQARAITGAAIPVFGRA